MDFWYKECETRHDYRMAQYLMTQYVCTGLQSYHHDKSLCGPITAEHCHS
jgi:hypothetical protein